MPTTSASQDVLRAFENWLTFNKALAAWRDDQCQPRPDIIVLQGIPTDAQVANGINREGYLCLNSAAEKTLRQLKLGRAVSLETARKEFERAFGEEIARALNVRVFYEDAVITSARKRIEQRPRESLLHVKPVAFCHSSNSTNLKLGPIRLVSAEVFHAEFGGALRLSLRHAGPGSYEFRLVRDWQRYSAKYDHFMLIQISGFESRLAQQHATDAANYVLNLIRMTFGLLVTDDIRLGGGFTWETDQTRLAFDGNGEARFGWSQGPYSAILPGDWQAMLETHISAHRPLLENFAHWMLEETRADDPVLERISYANSLITQLYCEPHDQIRVVRLIAALEALCHLTGSRKAEGLAERCALAGSYGDTAESDRIQQAVRYAYAVRNGVVHGDDPSEARAREAVLGVEEHLPQIVCAYMELHARIRTQRKPQSMKALRKEVEATWRSFFGRPTS